MCTVACNYFRVKSMDFMCNNLEKRLFSFLVILSLLICNMVPRLEIYLLIKNKNNYESICV